VFDGAEAGNGLSECDALFGVLNRVVQRRFGASQSAGAEFCPANIQDVESDVMALADFSDDVVDRNLRVIQ